MGTKNATASYNRNGSQAVPGYSRSGVRAAANDGFYIVDSLATEADDNITTEAGDLLTEES